MSDQHSLKRQNAALIRGVLAGHVIVFAFVLIGSERLLSVTNLKPVEILAGAGFPTSAALIFACLTKLELQLVLL